ncbi:hypothetical protein ASC97_05680 [Rhizobium sp. Root1203]|uniref:hypothetical protein n=1 Tax=Rhizobium sp. Root1203 TaxID=1736427 RepID=UPI00070D8589|nr:hypothetical protein [Rhizobium sp. Root1203]KQV27854.1 hypothetical protein ASC97_05680 [Rhizobium sp. Root1203]
MGEYIKMPISVEAFQVDQILRSPEDDWSEFPSWLAQIYADGQMIISADGITLLTGPEDAKALRNDYIVRDANGLVGVYDEATFERDFMDARPPNEPE